MTEDGYKPSLSRPCSVLELARRIFFPFGLRLLHTSLCPLLQPHSEIPLLFLRHSTPGHLDVPIPSFDGIIWLLLALRPVYGPTSQYGTAILRARMKCDKPGCAHSP